MRGCLIAICTWQEKYFMRIWAFSWKFTYMFLQIVEIETWLIQQLSRLSRPRLLETGPKLSRSRFFRDSHWSVSWNIFLLLLDKIKLLNPAVRVQKIYFFIFVYFHNNFEYLGCNIYQKMLFAQAWWVLFEKEKSCNKTIILIFYFANAQQRSSQPCFAN